MRDAARDADVEVIYCEPFDIVQNDMDRWPSFAGGKVYVLNCVKCNRQIVAHRYQRNYREQREAADMEQYRPERATMGGIMSNAPPPAKFRFRATTPGKFALEINYIKNPFVRAKFYRELVKRGVEVRVGKA